MVESEDDIEKLLDTETPDFLLKDTPLILTSDLISLFDPKHDIDHLSTTAILSFRTCPISFALSRLVHIETMNPYLLMGVKLHRILELFYYNIISPVPEQLELTDMYGNLIETISLGKNPTKNDIARYFRGVLYAIAMGETLETFLLDTNISESKIEDLVANAYKTLNYFAKEEAIRYMITPPHLFKPLLIEGELQYNMPNVPLSVIGYIDVVLPYPDPSKIKLIPKDYKNRSKISNPLYDKIQAYIYSYGLYKQYDYLPSRFYFKYIHGKTLSNPEIMYQNNMYPIFTEAEIKISKKKLPVIEKIVQEVYNKMQDPSQYDYNKYSNDCPQPHFCPYAWFCLPNGLINKMFVYKFNPELQIEENIRGDENKPYTLTNLKHIREGEEVNPMLDGFISITDYLNGEYQL